MLDQNIDVGLGTDGVASNNNLDLLEEAKIGSYLQKVDKFDAALLDTNNMLNMLTSKGTKSLKLNNLGRLKKGHIADLILVDTNNSSRFFPHHNNLSNLFYSAQSTSVNTVIVNGNILMKNRKLLTIDEAKVFEEIDKRAKKLA
jgi:5-methylthioadenosine/S-adenosylhomocysteine deaminase